MTTHDLVLREHGYHRLRIKAIVPETAEASSIVLDVPPDLGETFRYQPGQFCTFRVPIADEDHLRSYSMSSAPETDDDLAVTVKRVPGGLVSNWLLDHLADGDIVEVTRPAGVFCAQPTERPVVGCCGGSGITPVMSITKSVLTTTGRTVRLLYANRDRQSVIFDRAFAALQDRYRNRLELNLHFDSDRGFLGAVDIGRFLSGTPDADFYICGPTPFMDVVEAALSDMGVDPARVFIERFLVEKQLATPPDAVEVVGSDAPAELTLILGGKQRVVPYHPGDTVLETARRGGLRPPFSCEAGDCATCMAFLREGTVTMRANNALTAEEVAEGWILTCQSLPAGPVVTVEYEAM